MHLPFSSRRRVRGFTLVEILMATTIMGLATLGIVAFMRHGLKLYYMDRARTMVNRDIRSFTAMVDTDAVTANYFCIYTNYDTRTDASGNDDPCVDGEMGEFLVLVYTDPAQTGQGISMIKRIVGYYRQITDATNNIGPVRRFDTDTPGWPNPIPAAGVDIKSAPMPTILSTYVKGNASAYPIVTQLARGITNNTPLFYNRMNRSVMITTQIAESLTERGTTSQTGNTYNFTVSPRG